MKTVPTLHERGKSLPKSFKGFCGKRRQGSSFFVSATIVAAIILPGTVSAQVVINEIAWMGAVGNANAEWVELYNTGSSGVSLEEWTLVAQDGSPNIVLSGTVSAGGFFLLERTSDDTVPGSAAGVIYAGSLSNLGETLLLKNVGGTIVDTVVGGENWQGVGGDNVTKQTAQKTTNGWVTAAPTPGTANVGGSSEGGGSSSPDFDAGTTTTTSQSTNAGSSSGDSVMPPPPKVFADGGSDRTVIVGADTEFKARAYDERKNLIDFSRFHWNFGDGSVSDVTTVLHRFEYPGRYVVVLDMPEEKDAVGDQIIVTVEPVKLGLSLIQDGGVLIENHAGRTLDLSRWIIRSLGRMFTIPEHTFILAGSPLRISQKTLGFSTGPDIELDYPNGAFALGTAAVSVSTSTTTPAPLPEPAYGSQTVAMRAKKVVNEAVQDIESASTAPEAAVEATDGSPAQIAAAGIPTGSSSRVWWIGLVGIAGFAAGSLALARRYGKKEWDIIEENPK